jgi:hypothetical protein
LGGSSEAPSTCDIDIYNNGTPFELNYTSLDYNNGANIPVGHSELFDEGATYINRSVAKGHYIRLKEESDIYSVNLGDSSSGDIFFENGYAYIKPNASYISIYIN